MLRTFILLLIPSLSFAQTKVNYQVSYSDNLEQDGLKVMVNYEQKQASDSTYFHYSNEVWGQSKLMQCLDIRANENPNYRIRLVPDSNRIVVYHPKSKTVNFTYRIKQDYKGDKIDVFNRPRLSNQFFHILGQSLFSVPEAVFAQHEDNPRLNISLAWLNFPEGFKIHNTFGTEQHKQILKVKLWTDLYNSLFVGGDYRIYNFSYMSKPIYFAIRGKWLESYQDDKLLEALKKTISTQRAFWKDNNFDYYTVIMTPTVTQSDSLFQGQSTTGSGIKNGFLIQSSNNPFNNWNVINYIFNHEMMHDWIGGKIANKSEELNYWFSEGFTDYYAFKNRLRSGDLSLAQWTNEFNSEVIKAHWNNPERNKPNYLVKDEFWSSRNIEKIPYRRGAIFAFWLDNQIMKQYKCTKSLDDLMRDLLKICTTENKKFTDELFLNLVETYLNKDISYFFQKHVISGVDFDLKTEDCIDGFQINNINGMPQISVTDELSLKYIVR